MERSDAQISIKIVSRRTYSLEIFTNTDEDKMEYIMRELVENDNNVVNTDVDIGMVLVSPFYIY